MKTILYNGWTPSDLKGEPFPLTAEDIELVKTPSMIKLADLIKRRERQALNFLSFSTTHQDCKDHLVSLSKMCTQEVEILLGQLKGEACTAFVKYHEERTVLHERKY